MCAPFIGSVSVEKYLATGQTEQVQSQLARKSGTNYRGKPIEFDLTDSCYYPSHRCIDNCIHTYAGIQLRNYRAEIMEKQGHPESTGARLRRHHAS